MDHITQLLRQAMALIVFCIAVSILFLEYHNYCYLLKVVGNNINEKIVFEQQYDKTNNLVTSGELIALLCDKLEYDIEIDELLVSHYVHNKDSILTYQITDNEYIKSYVYDDNGDITRIIYNSRLDSTK